GGEAAAGDEEGDAAVRRGRRARRRGEGDRRRSGRRDPRGAPHAVDGEVEPRVFDRRARLLQTGRPRQRQGGLPLRRGRRSRAGAEVLQGGGHGSAVRAPALFALLLLPSLARAQPAVRYNEPPTLVPRAPLATRIDELVARIAKKERRAEPRPDARLDAAAADLARAVSSSGAPPNELVQGALWVHGIIEPPPQLILTAMGPGGEKELLDALGRDLPKVLSEGRFARVGVGIVPGRDGETRVLVALQESFVDLEPVARAQPLGGNVVVRGRLHDGFERPEAFVTAPDGRVINRVLVGGDPVRFGGV